MLRSLSPSLGRYVLLAAVLAWGPGLPVAHAQTDTAHSISSAYAPSRAHPFGQLNPAAPPETQQYAFMVGVFDCGLTYKTYRDGAWVVEREGRATWTARFVMDGYGVLDEFLDDEGETNVNVRVFDTEREVWLVHYTTVSPARGTHFEARQVGDRMVMLAEREAPNGYAYTERVAFEPQGPDAYRWTQEIVSPDGSSFVMGDIHCQRR